jgi:hypothetical protein
VNRRRADRVWHPRLPIGEHLEFGSVPASRDTGGRLYTRLVFGPIRCQCRRPPAPTPIRTAETRAFPLELPFAKKFTIGNR